jgi:hypothetical protein
MQGVLPIRCPSCGTVVGTGGGRCPTCGYLLPEEMPRKAVTLSRPPPQRRKPARGAVVALVAASVLAAVVLILLVRARLSARRTVIALTPSSAAGPRAGRVPAPPATAVVDVGSYAAGAASRASAWNADALLVSIEAFPVQRGKVTMTDDAFVEVIYGKPLKLRIGPGAPLTATRLVLRVDRDGARETQRSEARAQKGIAEPNCPVDEVSRVVEASGIAQGAPVRLRYAESDRRKRPVWRASAEDPKDTRIVDGQSCALLPK